MPEIKHSQELVIFEFIDGTYGSWCKTVDKWGNVYGHSNRVEWRGGPGYPTPLEYTEILAMADYIPMVAKQLEQLMLLYNLNKDDFHDNTET